MISAAARQRIDFTVIVLKSLLIVSQQRQVLPQAITPPLWISRQGNHLPLRNTIVPYRNIISWPCSIKSDVHPFIPTGFSNPALIWYTLHIRLIVADSSAWTGLEEEAPVDEEEAVRKVSGEPPGYHHSPGKVAYKTRR